MRTKFYMVFLCLFSMLLSTQSYGETTKQSQKFVIGTYESVISSDLSNQLENYLTSTYSKLGLEINFSKMPQQRSEAMLKSGKIDAEIGRLVSYIEKKNYLRTIPTPLLKIKVIIWTTEDRKSITPKTAVSVRGFDYTRVLPYKMEYVNSVAQLVDVVKAGRVDCGISIYYKEWGDLDGMDTKGFVKLFEQELPVFHVVHEKWEPLVVPLNSHFKKEPFEKFFHSVSKI